MLKQKNTKMQGNVGLGAAIAYATSKGWIVLIPLNDSQSYDLIVDDGNQLLKVQVKTTDFKTDYDIYQCRLKSCGGTAGNVIKPFDNTTCDIVCILAGDGRLYWIPSSNITCTNSINLGDDKNKFLVKP